MAAEYYGEIVHTQDYKVKKLHTQVRALEDTNAALRQTISDMQLKYDEDVTALMLKLNGHKEKPAVKEVKKKTRGRKPGPRKEKVKCQKKAQQ